LRLTFFFTLHSSSSGSLASPSVLHSHSYNFVTYCFTQGVKKKWVTGVKGYSTQMSKNSQATHVQKPMPSEIWAMFV
jgi:hypothetical protein